MKKINHINHRAFMGLIVLLKKLFIQTIRAFVATTNAKH